MFATVAEGCNAFGWPVAAGSFKLRLEIVFGNVALSFQFYGSVVQPSKPSAADDNIMQPQRYTNCPRSPNRHHVELSTFIVENVEVLNRICWSSCGFRFAISGWIRHHATGVCCWWLWTC